MQSPSEPPSVPTHVGPAASGDNIGGYEFNWLIMQLERYGKKQFGEPFMIREEDHDIIRRLLVYFLADAALAVALGIDLSKGILLTGPIGCGKTSLMSLMRLVPKPERGFTLKSTRDVSFEFIDDGYAVIHRYSKLSYNHSGPRTYCFDDLGAEQALKYFGNECNVLAEIFLSRYDHYIASGMVTHLTTNLSATEIEESYGSRVRSRMREMFNLVAFDNVDDKRRL
jgi:energy-coupling factor transporter ATP-binding protein EcfA2